MAKGQIAPENTTMSFVIPRELKKELGILATKENRSMGKRKSDDLFAQEKLGLQ